MDRKKFALVWRSKSDNCYLGIFLLFGDSNSAIYTFSLNILMMVFNCFAFYTTFCNFYKVSSLTCFNDVTVEMTLNGNYFPKNEILSGRRRVLISSSKYHVFAQFMSSRKKSATILKMQSKDSG